MFLGWNTSQKPNVTYRNLSIQRSLGCMAWPLFVGCNLTHTRVRTAYTPESHVWQWELTPLSLPGQHWPQPSRGGQPQTAKRGRRLGGSWTRRPRSSWVGTTQRNAPERRVAGKVTEILFFVAIGVASLDDPDKPLYIVTQNREDLCIFCLHFRANSLFCRPMDVLTQYNLWMFIRANEPCNLMLSHSTLSL